jgi:hypothetical protein
MTGETQIIYIPGMKPKPPVEAHEEMLWRCLLNGVGRASPNVARDLARQRDIFRVAPWSRLFYDEQTSVEPDLPGVERLLALDGPEDDDLLEARHWHKRVGKLIYLLSDKFPFLINWLANPDLEETLKETRRYFEDEDGVATRIRQLIADRLLASWTPGSRLLVIAHSLGSVIAFDTLWELSYRKCSDIQIDLFMTLGSPLGLNFIRHRMLNARESGVRQFPTNIRRWSNFAAIGEMTALDRKLADDYHEMVELELVDSIHDEPNLQTYFRGPDGLNVHKCYGYMANHKTGAAIAEWVSNVT